MRDDMDSTIADVRWALRDDATRRRGQDETGPLVPVVYAIVDYRIVIVSPLHADIDDRLVRRNDDGTLMEASDAIAAIWKEICQSRRLVRSFRNDVARVCPQCHLPRHGEPFHVEWDVPDSDMPVGAQMSYGDFACLVETLNGWFCGGGDHARILEPVAARYVPVADRTATFLTRTEAERHLARGRYTQRARVCRCPSQTAASSQG